MLVINKRKCLRCWNTFHHASGGFINKPDKAVCPKCGSHMTIIWF